VILAFPVVKIAAWLRQAQDNAGAVLVPPPHKWTSRENLMDLNLSSIAIPQRTLTKATPQQQE